MLGNFLDIRSLTNVDHTQDVTIMFINGLLTRADLAVNNLSK